MISLPGTDGSFLARPTTRGTRKTIEASGLAVGQTATRFRGNGPDSEGLVYEQAVGPIPSLHQPAARSSRRFEQT